jgi:hypothetical protein
MEDAEERAAFDIANIRQTYLEETGSMRLEHYVSNVGVQSAKEGFGRVARLTAEAIQAAVRDVEDPNEIITAIVQANDELMSAQQEKKARSQLYRCVSDPVAHICVYGARIWARARIWAWGPYLGMRPVSGPGARIWA